ncbi:MAG: global cell cycle regulator GcrA-like protein [Rickettsiales bacterium TMED254]|nr:global cell cycle regulator GcrA-like protein [Rickettsiales bacterium]RPF77283.1 MAG: global cell cycle regulator GcrA-like protein [Rickettsiales bacterium TMED254]|tara:strand:- start:435 stop:815 length:381 start_codon:yes stop_codon:yes gene_type:complete
MKNYWTKKKVDKLTSLWEQGVSAREIATKLGHVSRNAVIGKANRLGISKKNNEDEKNKKINIDIASLVPNMSGCKWPIGHPGDLDFYFCGKPVIPGKPYCGEHCLIAYRRKDSSQKIKKFFKLSNE